jgi:aspartate/methionine/tyrosine aminotransferase
VFSDRVDFDLRKNRLTHLLEEKKKTETRIFDLTESNPTVAGLVYPKTEILEALHTEGALTYRPSAKGLSATRRAIAQYYLDRGVEISPEHLILTASTSEAYAFLFKLLTNPGDEVLIPRPSYPLFDFLARLEAVRTRSYPLHYQQDWQYDLGLLESCLNENTKAIVIVNPNNPTGSYISSDEWEQLRQMALRYDIPIICDEVFVDYPLSDGQSLVDPAASDDHSLFLLNGFSKLAGLPQFKLGWIGVKGPTRPTRERLERLEVIADTFLSVSAPIQHAGPALLGLAGRIREQIQCRVRANYRNLSDLCRGTSVENLKTLGGWYANLRLPRIHTEEQWTLQFLGSADTLVHPGYFYDFSEEAYVVISLLPKPAIFEEGVSRLLTEVG